jgi:hypothetical protein
MRPNGPNPLQADCISFIVCTIQISFIEKLTDFIVLVAEYLDLV